MANGYDVKDWTTYNNLPHACKRYMVFHGNGGNLEDGPQDLEYIYTTNYRVQVNVPGMITGGWGWAGGTRYSIYAEFTRETIRTNSWVRCFQSTHRDDKWTGGERSNSKRRRSKYRDRLEFFCRIDNEYQLGLTSAEIAQAAYDYADKTMGGAKWYETGSGILSPILVIVAIVLMFIPGGQAAGTALIAKVFALTIATAAKVALAVNIIAAIAAVAAFAGQQYYQHTANKAAGEAMSANRYKAADAALENQRKVEEERAQLTALMIYGGYEIYANGSIYKKGAPGSQTYNSQIHFDANKGILGQLKNDEFGEQLQGRYGGKLGGGEYFHQNLMQVDFPLQKFNYSKEQKLDLLEKRLKRNCVRVAKGFTQLFEGYFNADEQGESKYNRIYKLHTDPIKSNMKSIAFLDTLQCYSRDEMQTFDYIDQTTFRERKQNTDPVWIYFNSETFKAFMENDEIGSYLMHGYSEDEAKKLLLQKKVKMYLQQLGIIFNALEDMADEAGVYCDLKYLIITPEWVSDSGSGHTEYSFRYVNFELYEKKVSLNTQQISFLGKIYYTTGYNTNTIAIHTGDNEAFALSEFDLFGGFYKEDFNRNNFTGEDMLKIYDEFLSRLIKINLAGTELDSFDKQKQITKCFLLFKENKTIRTMDSIDSESINAGTIENEYFAIEMSEKAYNTLSTRLYIPEKLKEDFEKWDWASQKGFL